MDSECSNYVKGIWIMIEEDIRTVGGGGRKVRSLLLCSAQHIVIGEV